MIKFLRRESSGITLVALVITIILLLILAGITITQLTANGLLEKAKEAKEKSDESTAREIIITKIYEYQLHEINNNKNATLEGLKEYFKDNQEIEYIDLYVKRDDLETVQTGEIATHTKIKLKDYKYVYLLDQNLNIVQVDGNVIEDEESKLKIDDELEKLLKEANMKITLEDILNTPAIMENMKGLIPTLTENDVTRSEENGIVTYNDNTEGIIKANSEYDSAHALWMAFDDNNDTHTLSLGWEFCLEYEFPQEVYAMQIKYIFSNGASAEGTRVIAIQGYNVENGQWENLSEDLTWTGNGASKKEDIKNLNYSKSFKKYRLYVKSATGSTAHSGVYKIQLYGVVSSKLSTNSEENLKQLFLENLNTDTITLSQMVTNKDFTKRLIDALSVETVTNNETLMNNLTALIPILSADDVTKKEENGVIEYSDKSGGVIRSNSERILSNGHLWHAFDNNSGTCAFSNVNAAEGWYLEYEFPQNVCVLKAKYQFTSGASLSGTRIVSLQGYNEDLSKWEEVNEDKEISGVGVFEEVSENLRYKKTYKKYRFYVKSATADNRIGKEMSGLVSMQFYGKVDR